MIECTVLVSDKNLEAWLISTFKISKNQLKKSIDHKKKLLSSAKFKELIKIPINIANHLKINPEYDGDPIKILFDNEDFLVVSKPEKIHCHPHSYDEKNNVLSFLRSIGHFNVLNINEHSYDRSLLYRLDFETSGVLILSKRLEDYTKIRNHFNDLMKKKEYLAIVKNDFVKIGDHAQYFLGSEKKSSKQKVFNEQVKDSQIGKMHIEKLAYDSRQNLSLLKVSLSTGLRHQIRAGLSYLGFPILGDELYGEEKNNRLYLHAYRYELEYNQRRVCFKDDQPNLFNHFFNFNSLL